MVQKVLVCGATGFIGRNLIERLSKRKDIKLFATYLKSPHSKTKNVTFKKVDLCNADEVNNIIQGMDVVIQAAAITSGSKDIIERPYIHVTDNAIMNSLILRAAYEHHVSQLVFLSCSVMYQSNNQPVKESDFNPNHEIFSKYFGVGWTKVYIEKMCEFYSQLGRTKHTVIRHSNVYGPYDKFDLKHSHVFGALLTKVLTAKKQVIDLWGDGSEKRDLLYVDDLVDFIEIAMKKQETNYELINIGSGSCVSIKELAKVIIKCAKKALKIRFDVSAPSIKIVLCLDISKASEKFNWKPKTPLKDGIIRTLQWYEKNRLEKV